MASTDFSQQVRDGVEALRADDHADPQPACRAGDLKGLLNAIVDQISDADRRHSDTLHQMQERLVGIGREAKSIKPRVPDQFAAAFERIEAGMAELASRIADVKESGSDTAHWTQAATAPSQTQTTASAQPMFGSASNFGEPPAALRSAADSNTAAARRREEEVSRSNAGIDTFDVIESDMPESMSDPWDRDAAEALTGLYESGAVGFKSKSFVASAPLAEPKAASHTYAATATASPGVDHTWFEQRFAEISSRIDESLNEIRPDQGFFSLGQRVDQLEQHFSNLIEGVATRGDVEGVRLIEAHVSELAGHLENAHQQLMRLDMIEDQLVGIAGKLDDVHRAASAEPLDAPAPMYHQPEIDLQSVARTAAEAAAQQFAKMQPMMASNAPETSEIGSMLRGFIAESRQGEENTTALLDTLQQAMIRLLDRVDAMELTTLQTAQAQAFAHAQAAPQEYVREQVRFGVDQARGHANHDGEPTAALDAAVAAVASAKTMASPFSQSPTGDELSSSMASRSGASTDGSGQRTPEKIRQDFIAEARRAKMRLAAESDGEMTGVGLDHADGALSVDTAKLAAPSARGAAKSTSAVVEKKAAAGNTPRIKVLALSAVLALGGVWLAKESGLFSGQSAIATTPSETPASDVATSTDGKAIVTSPTTTPDATVPAAGSADVGPGDLKLPEGTRGEIVTDEITVGSTSVPLHGVTVDSERPMTAADLARAKRQQAMAAVSGQLGQAAQQNPAAFAMPAALHPDSLTANAIPLDQNVNQAEKSGLTSITKSNMSQSSALDLPPATVGPLSLRLAAANGDPSAEFEVGARLAEGKGTEQTFNDAAKWYQRSASKGFAQAQYRLGTLYERGLGLKTDPARAVEWYTRSAEQGNIKAMHNLAVLSANQSKGAPDYVTAAMWFEKAAEFGLSDSQFNLAVLKENGLGVEQDPVTAYKWLALAAKSGDKEAIKRRDILKGKITGDQLTKAEALVTGFVAKRAIPDVNDARKAGEAWKKNPDNGVNG